MHDERPLIRGRNFGVFFDFYCHNGSAAHDSGKSFFSPEGKDSQIDRNISFTQYQCKRCVQRFFFQTFARNVATEPGEFL